MAILSQYAVITISKRGLTVFGLTLILLAGLVAMATGLILKFAIFYQKHILSKIDQLEAKNAIKFTVASVSLGF